MKFTVRELSEELGISRQAIFNQIKRNPDLKEHIEKQGNKFYIDEIGQDIIRERSIGSSQSMVTDQSLLRELEALRKENSDLKDVIIRLQAEKYETVKLLADAEVKEKLLEESQKELDERIRYMKILERELEQHKSSYELLQEQLKNVELDLAVEKKKTWWDKLRGR